MASNRYFVKQVTTYVVYDRLTGKIVGDTIETDTVVKRVMIPKGLHYDERMPINVTPKIPVGSEDLFHKEIKRLRYATACDKTFEENN